MGAQRDQTGIQVVVVVPEVLVQIPQEMADPEDKTIFWELIGPGQVVVVVRAIRAPQEMAVQVVVVVVVQDNTHQLLLEQVARV
jgi:hypothetical protein